MVHFLSVYSYTILWNVHETFVLTYVIAATQPLFFPSLDFNNTGREKKTTACHVECMKGLEDLVTALHPIGTKRRHQRLLPQISKTSRHRKLPML